MTGDALIGGLVVAVDPGLRACGVSVWVGKTLTRAALVKNPETTLRDMTAWRTMGKAVVAWLGPVGPLRVLVCEKPQVYAGRRAGGDPDDLMQLVGVDGALSVLLDAGAYVTYLPRTWKGTVPKDIHVKRIEAKLTPQEVAAIEKCAPSLRHNILDSIGIGLYHLGR